MADERKQPSAEKLKALQLAIDKIDKDFGKGAIMKLGDDRVEDVAVIPTGSVTLNLALGVGGYPRGRVVEIFGPESSGKTTLAIHAMAEVQRQGGIAAIIDAEHAFDRFYAEKLGVDIDNLLIAQPDSGEQALEIADKLISSAAVDLIVVFAEEYDSVLHYTMPAANDYLKMLRAQAFAYLGTGDSAVIYARELLPRTDNPFYLDDIYYILTHNDATADAEAIRELSSERADVQKAIEQRHGKLMQAVQLLADDLASPRRNMRPLLEALLLAFGCLVIAVTGITVLRERRKLYRESSAHEQARREEFERTASILRTAENLRDELKWNDYEAFCRQTDKLFRGLATILDKEGLNEQDVRICVLVLIGLSGKQIAAMLPCSQKSIGKLKDLTARKLGVSGGKLQKKLQSIVCGW